MYFSKRYGTKRVSYPPHYSALKEVNRKKEGAKGSSKARTSFRCHHMDIFLISAVIVTSKRHHEIQKYQ